MLKYAVTFLFAMLLSGCDLALFESFESGSVMLYWSAPQQRSNGDPMTISDIGGYEIRYRNSKTPYFKTILIRDADIDQYRLNNIVLDNLVIEVAVFDTNGIYSDFVRAAE